MRQNWKSAFAVEIGRIILKFIARYAVASGLGLSLSESLFLALLLCATSVSIFVQALKELNQLNSKEGSTILRAAVVDDVVVILLAVMLSLLGTTECVLIPALIGKKALFFVVVIAVSFWIIPIFMKLIAKLKVTEALMRGALIVCFSFAYFAEKMGVAGIIGAFSAGIAISQTTFRHEVEKKVEPIAYTLFVPVFFVSIGLNFIFNGVGNNPYLSLCYP